MRNYFASNVSGVYQRDTYSTYMETLKILRELEMSFLQPKFSLNKMGTSSRSANYKQNAESYFMPLLQFDNIKLAFNYQISLCLCKQMQNNLKVKKRLMGKLLDIMIQYKTIFQSISN